MRNVKWVPVVAALAAMTPPQAIASDYKTIWIDPGSSEDIYWEVNLSGKVYLSADVDGQSACLDYWWIVWPFAQIKSLGRHCGRVSFDVPGFRDFAVGGKLRAGNAVTRTRVFGASAERVANTFPVNF